MATAALPELLPESSLEKDYLAFLKALKESSFQGEIASDYASRLAMATDNSIYQQLPQAVVYPKHTLDVEVMCRVGADFPSVTFSPRGGGTGTNGQSLTKGVIVDLSRHMTKILEINAREGWVRVQTGLVKDKLNDALRPHGLFFAPDLSTSNRATIGGMINTDASGQGSLVYGKTSDHVMGLTAVLANGEVLNTAPRSISNIDREVPAKSSLEKVYQQVVATCVDKRDLVLEKFPKLNRFLTGYDLVHPLNSDAQTLDLARILAGSEGSLAFITEAKLNVTPIPSHTALVNIKYDSFEAALRHAPVMVEADATSVETVDSKVLGLARGDIIWHSVNELIADVPNADMQGLNMVEYNSEDESRIRKKIADLCQQLDQAIAAESREEQGRHKGVIGYQVTFSRSDIQKIYAMRKKAVGLLGKAPGWQKPIAFAEDTAVPPENLADFILEFRDILDAHDLDYGMFGHVDAGVLHVRPALDMCDPKQQALMSTISKQVVELVAKYGGLMWGEHGKGYRSEFAPAFFGEELFAEIRKIKAAFDPYNRMNPGKICTPFESDAQLVSISDPMRGDWDRQIPIQVKDAFSPAMSCNGNGLCFNYDLNSPMCPSSKVTRDRRHSPKGRAGMMREWLRLASNAGVDLDALSREKETPWAVGVWRRIRGSNNDFSHQVKEVMDGCLACKACTSQCPVNVDVPGFRSRFLAFYHTRYGRPLSDYLVANVERLAPVLAKAPRLVNWLQNNALSAWVLKHGVGYVDAPKLSVPALEQPNTDTTLEALQSLSQAQRDNTVLIVQDPFTSFYDAAVVDSTCSVLESLGYNPVLLPFHPNGKPQHVKGFLQKFARTAKGTADFLTRLSELGMPMVGVDASLVLCYRDEYVKALGEDKVGFKVWLISEWLATQSETIQQSLALGQKNVSAEEEFTLLGHCSEKTAIPETEAQWQSLFSLFGLTLNTAAVGCCGMAGTFGHETKTLTQSSDIFAQSWKPALIRESHTRLLATGYSCRSQVKRFSDHRVQHPMQALARVLCGPNAN